MFSSSHIKALLILLKIYIIIIIVNKKEKDMIYMKLLIIFIVLNVLNVIIQTVKSICTIKCGKVSAALINAVAFGLYTIVLVYMNCDLNLFTKAGIVALCNLIGVYVVKLIEEKMRKDKLWKVELTVNKECTHNLADELDNFDIPHNWLISSDDKYAIFNIYCATQKESAFVKAIAERFNAKYFVTESKNL